MLKTLDFWSSQNARNISDSEQMWAGDGGDSEASGMRLRSSARLCSNLAASQNSECVAQAPLLPNGSLQSF